MSCLAAHPAARRFGVSSARRARFAVFWLQGVLGCYWREVARFASGFARCGEELYCLHSFEFWAPRLSLTLAARVKSESLSQIPESRVSLNLESNAKQSEISTQMRTGTARRRSDLVVGPKRAGKWRRFSVNLIIEERLRFYTAEIASCESTHKSAGSIPGEAFFFCIFFVF